MPYFLLGSQLLGSLNKTEDEIRSKASVPGSNGEARVLKVDKETFSMGNLDSLWFMLNQLSKLDTQIESNLKKMDRQVKDLDPQHTDFYVETREDGKKTIENFIYSFKWDDSKYPRSNLQDCYKTMHHRVTLIEADLRGKTAAFQEKKNTLNQIFKKESGNSLTRDLSDVLKQPLVSENDFVYSDYLTTAVAVVPKAQVENWVNNYEKFNDMVVPGSTKKFEVDLKDGYVLFRVIIFKTALEEFQNSCKNDHKITIRDFHFDPTESLKNESKKNLLKSETDQMTKSILDLSNKYFSDLYSAYIHLKVLKLLIDSVLRFGVKEKIFAQVVKPNDGKERKIHTALTKLFADPNNLQMYGTKEELEDTEDYFPYACVSIAIP